MQRKKDLHPIDFLGIVGVLVVWEIFALIVGSTRVPSLELIVQKIIQIFYKSPELIAQGTGGKNVIPHLIYTIIGVISGALVGTSLGIGLGLLMGQNWITRELFRHPIEALRAIPPLGAIPFLLMWFGRGRLTQFLFIVFYCFLVIVVYTLNAIRNVDPIYIQFAKTLGATDRNLFRSVVLPLIVPELMGGIRVALAMSWGFMVVAEMMGAPYGMGKFFAILIPFLATSSVIAGIIVIVLIAFGFDRLLLIMMKRITRWVPREA